MSSEIVAALGLILTVVLAVAGFFIAKKVRSKKQIQTVKSNSVAYQAGRDVQISSKNDAETTR